MDLADWLTQHQPHDGYLLGMLRFFEQRWDRISLGSVLNRRVKRRFIAEDGKAPRWVSELYVVLCLVVAGALFFLVPSQARSFWLVLAAWAVYRVVDLLAFVVGWIFVHTDPLHSIQRSLLSFFLNIVELNLLFGFLELVATGVTDASRLQYLVTHLTAFATVSVIGDVGISSVGGVIELVRVFASLLLVLVIVGSLAGNVVRRTTVPAAEGSQGSQQEGVDAENVVREEREQVQSDLSNQLGHAVSMAAKEDQIVWTIFGVFWTANAVLLVALFTTGAAPSRSVGIVVCLAGATLSWVWFLIQRRAIGWLEYYERIIQETRGEVPAYTGRRVAQWAAQHAGLQ